jgi:hypothetical protein
MNLFKLINSEFNKPKGVFIQWPNHIRLTFPTQEIFSDPDKRLIQLSVKNNAKIVDSFLQTGDTIETFSMFSFNCTLNFLKQHKIKNISFSVDKELKKTIKFFPIKIIARSDRARDNLHIGSDCNKLISKYILDEL